MEKYEFEGATFQVDFSGCDGSSEWEIKVTDGKSTASITWNAGGNSMYGVTQLESGTRWSLNSEKKAIEQACRAVAEYSARVATSPEDACKALMELVKNS